LITTRIGNPGNGLEASIIKPSHEKTGFNVLTRPAKVYENQVKFFVNGDNGADMAIDADVLVVSEWIHDGIDNPYWVAAALSGVWVFNSALENHTPAGALCISAIDTVSGDTAQIVRGAGLLALADPITSLGVWVWIVSWSSASGLKQILFRGWDTGAAVQVGTDVNLADYIDTTVTGAWQHAIVPLVDMNLQELSIDAVHIQTVTLSGPVPDYYIDDVQVLEGSPIEYTIEPDADTWLHVDGINVTLVDAYTGIVADGTMPDIPYNAFLGVAAVDNGILYQRFNNGEVDFSTTIRQLFDYIRLPGFELVGSGSDGTNTWVKLRVKVTEPLILRAENNDILKISLSDDFSGLLELQMSAGCRKETRQGDLYE